MHSSFGNSCSHTIGFSIFHARNGEVYVCVCDVECLEDAAVFDGGVMRVIFGNERCRAHLVDPGRPWLLQRCGCDLCGKHPVVRICMTNVRLPNRLF